MTIMFVFLHVCDLMFLDEKSFHYEPYYQVYVDISISVFRIMLDTRNLTTNAHFRIIFPFSSCLFLSTVNYIPNSVLCSIISVFTFR